MNDIIKTLPKIDKPIFELKLPSNGKKIKYTPFSVKEEKILLIAQKSDDMEQAILSIKQVVNNCLIGVKIEDLPMFDLEYLLITLRSKSVDNMIKFTVVDPDTKEKINLELDIEKIEIKHDPKHTNKLKVNDEYYLIMRYPTIDEFIELLANDSDPEINYKIMIACIDQLVSQDEVYKFSDFEEKQINEFMESLESSVIEEMKVFFETAPKLRHELQYKNSNGDDKTFVIEGINTFFI